MLNYVIKDSMAMLPHLLYGAIGGLAVAILLSYCNQRRTKKNQPLLRVTPYVAFGAYAVMLLTITFLSRESGTSGVVDLELFSTLKINTRNNAYVIENVLLFIPYGIVLPWAAEWARRLWKCAFLGALSSLAIESMQLLTQRGCFQVDDILTNWIGSIMGYFIFWIGSAIYSRMQAKSTNTTNSEL